MDKYGYLYFKDRTGDTFRWKGENVSTAEVEAIIHNAVQLNDATVYGVEIPGVEGRAGMAAIVDEADAFNLRQFIERMQQQLPPYARPIFIRLCKEVDTTEGTYKLKKTDLQKQGFNPNVLKDGDHLFYWNATKNSYESLTKEIYEDIMEQKLKF